MFGNINWHWIEKFYYYYYHHYYIAARNWIFQKKCQILASQNFKFQKCKVFPNNVRVSTCLTGCQSWRLKKYSTAQPGERELGSNQAERQNFFWSPTLTASSSTALWPFSLSKSLAALLRYFISIQRTLNSIVFI